jgi:Phosphatidylglycerol lysyltransferase, C-terminal
MTELDLAVDEELSRSFEPCPNQKCLGIQKRLERVCYMFSPKEQIAQASDTKAELIRYYGRHTLAFFGLAQQNVHFLAPGEEGLVNYRVEGNVAVVLGDPVCAPGAFERVTRSFLDFCTLRHWRVAFYQTYPDHLSAYRALQLHAFKIGEEALIDPQTFTLHGSASANVRISARRAERDEVVIQWYEGVLPVEAMNQLEHISNAWLGHKAGQQTAEMGFSMGRLEELPTTAERAEMLASISLPSNTSQSVAPRVVTAVATTSSSEPCAFVTFIPVYGSLTHDAATTGNQSEVLGTNPHCQRGCASTAARSGSVQGVGTNPSLQRHCESCNGSCQRDCVATDCVRQARPKEVSTASPEASMQGEGWGWTLDLMRRAPDAPPGVIELLLVRAIERFRLCGAHIVSLGMAAMADTRQEMAPGQRQLAAFVTDRLHLLESRHTLFTFKEKFHPHWESRYIVINSTLALPKIALAVLRIRNYAGGRSRSLFSHFVFQDGI